MTGWPETFKLPVIGSQAVVTTNHPEASAAAIEMLAMGGNAIDAAVSALFALSVVEPMMVSPCGAGFFVIHDARSGETTTIDNYATVPLAARSDQFTPVPGSLENETVDGANDWGYLAVGVPGALAGWCSAAERFGRLPLTELVAPAIRQASRGFKVSPLLAQTIAEEQPLLRQYPASAEVFLPGGHAPRPGDRLTRTDYALTLERMGQHGARELIDGETAQAMVADMRANGGQITIEDLRAYRLYDRAPVTGHYRGAEILTIGPVSSGGLHIVQMLNILSGFDLRLSGFGTVETVHLLAEALKIAFADRAAWLADPATTPVPVSWLTSPSYADQRREEILNGQSRAQTYRATEITGGEGSSTTHVNVMDADGMVVSATQTLNGHFGSRITTPGTGMLLNNCMKLMDPRPDRTNSIAPGKRILSSMSPTLLLRDGAPWMAIGTPGGHRIFAAVLQGIVNLIDHSMTPQQAVEAPRMWTMGPELELEEDFPRIEALVAGLEARGHVVQVVPRIAGGMGAIVRDPDTGQMAGATCWRADGSPAALSGGDAHITV